MRCFSFYAVFIVALCLNGVGSASEQDIAWQNTFGGAGDDWAHCVRKTSDGGFIVAGETHSFGEGGDFYLLKVDSQGDKQWERNYGGVDRENAYAVVERADGGYIIVGSTRSYGAGSEDIYVVWTDKDGFIEYYQTYGGSGSDVGSGICATSDGSYVIVGWTHSGSSSDDAYIVQIDGAGTKLWDNRFGGTCWDYGTSVAQAGGTLIFVGETCSLGSGGDVYFVKTDLSGQKLIEKAIGGVKREIGVYFRLTSGTQCVIPGWTQSIGAGLWDMYFVKTDLDGNVLREKAFGGPDHDFAWAIEEAADGGYFIVGYTRSFGAGDYDIYVVRTDQDGEQMWTKTIGSSGAEYAYSTDVTTDGGFVIAGASNSESRGGFDVILVKMGGTTTIQIDIDIKPGSYPNSINLGSHGLVPVGILSSSEFDATTVDPETVELAGAGVGVRGKSNKYMAHEEDVNADGLVDLVLQVATENLDPGAFQDGFGVLTGSTYDGQSIQGVDEVTIVPSEQ